MTEDKILLVARYVEGDMSEKEISDFEKRLKTEINLQEDLIAYRNIHQSLKMHLAKDSKDQVFKDSVSKIGKIYFNDDTKFVSKEETKVVPFKQYTKWLSAAAAILIIGLFIWAPWNSDLYSDYAANDQMSVTERGAEKQTDLDKAAALFNEQKYVDAEVYLQNIYRQNPADEMAAYYYGVTLIQNNKIDNGRNILTKIYAGESAFKYDAAFKIGLSYLKEDKKVDCKVWLQKIPTDAANYSQAKELLDKL